MPGDCPEGAGPENSPASRTSMDRYQQFVPLITALITVLSFFSGILLTAYQARKSSVEAENSEWRSSLQKISFEEKDLVPSAFLLESFTNSRLEQYKYEARQLQISMLDRTARPEVFDLVFQSMLTDARTAEDVRDMLGVGINLDAHLKNVYAMSLKKLPIASRPAFETFLKQPLAVLDVDGHPLTDTEKTTLNRLYVLMWELDTFSDGMDCIWNTQSQGCPHLQEGLDGAEKVLLMNHQVIPKRGAGAFPNIQTCSVQHAELDNDYTCE